jgi:hypothetical protein
MQLPHCRLPRTRPLLSPATSALLNSSTVCQPVVTLSLFDTSQSPGKRRAAELHHPRACPPLRCKRLLLPIRPSCVCVHERLSPKVPALGPLKKSASSASSASASEEPDVQAPNSQHPAYDIRHGEDLIKQVRNLTPRYFNVHCFLSEISFIIFAAGLRRPAQQQPLERHASRARLPNPRPKSCSLIPRAQVLTYDEHGGFWDR